MVSLENAQDEGHLLTAHLVLTQSPIPIPIANHLTLTLNRRRLRQNRQVLLDLGNVTVSGVFLVIALSRRQPVKAVGLEAEVREGLINAFVSCYIPFSFSDVVDRVLLPPLCFDHVLYYIQKNQ